MVLNPDPRPGRWLLPLVILGMMLFTYVFVQNLPAADTDGQSIGAESGDTVVTTTTTVPEATTTTASSPVSPETQAYVDQVATAETALLSFQGEMADINGQWDADPRQIEYQDALAQLQDLAARLDGWSSDLAAIVPPVTLSEPHGVLVTIATATADAADAVVAGLEAPDADPRIVALEEFDTAVTQFTAAVDDIELRATTTGA